MGGICKSKSRLFTQFAVFFKEKAVDIHSQALVRPEHIEIIRCTAKQLVDHP